MEKRISMTQAAKLMKEGRFVRTLSHDVSVYIHEGADIQITVPCADCLKEMGYPDSSSAMEQDAVICSVVSRDLDTKAAVTELAGFFGDKYEVFEKERMNYIKGLAREVYMTSNSNMLHELCNLIVAIINANGMDETDEEFEEYMRSWHRIPNFAKFIMGAVL